jgi:3-hydroxyisobutyrate dehydrogenase-like beta-hydroxyacid dehydrogenase
MLSWTPARCEPLAALGASVCPALADLASFSDVVITMISDTPDVEEILFQPQGWRRP